jgi:plastocyanin
VTAVAVAVAAAILAAEAHADTRTVRVGDNWFVRSGAENPTVTVRKGDRVTWRWVGDSLHSVRVARGPVTFSSGTPKSSGTFSRRLRRRGTYRILCSVHPAKQKMTLRVR